MPPTRSPQSKSTHPEFPWQGRLYAIRVLFTAMVLVMLAVSDAACRNQPGAHFWLLVSGAAYPHLGHLLLGRFEARRRRGYAVLIIDGLFSGAVMAAIGLASAPSAVLAAINLFNWMVVGGPALAILGTIAALTGIALSGVTATSSLTNACMASDVLAGAVLLGYFLVVARFIHIHIGTLRQQHSRFQAESDATTRARKLADRALIAVLPSSAAEVLAEKGELPTETFDGATVLLLEFARARSESPTIADLADCFRICDAIISRHGLECIKTFGRRYLAMTRAKTGPDDAVAAAREVCNFMIDHPALAGSPAAQRPLRAFVHCGTVSTGLVQPSRLNFEVLGEPMEALDALATLASDQPMGIAVASTAAQRRMQNAAGFVATPAGPHTTMYLSSLMPSP